MSTLLNPILSMAANPSPVGFVSHLPTGFPHFPSVNKGFPRVLASTQITLSPKDSAFTITGSSWKPDDPRSDEPRLNNHFSHLQALVTKGQKPNVTHSTQLLYDLCKANRLKKAIRVIELMVTSGVIPDASAYTYLVNQLCKRGNVGYAMQLVEKMEHHGFPPNTVTHNALVRGLCMLGSLSQSLQFVERLMERGLAPNAFTYSFLLEAAYKERGTDEAVKLLEEIVAKGGEVNLVCYNVLLTGFCKEGRTDDALKMFREMMPEKGFKPNVVSYNICLRCLCCDGRWEEANELLAEMDGGDKSPSVVTYNILINSLAFHGRTDQAMEVLSEMGRGVTATSYNPVIARLCKEGKVDLVVKCLDDMIYRRCKPNEGTYNALGALCDEHNNKVREAFYIIQSLSKRQRCCTHDFYKSVITSLCRKGNTFAAFRLLCEMTRCGFEPDSHTYSALIRGLCNEGMFGGAMEVLSIMEESEGCNKPTVDNFNAMILGFCKIRRTDLALEVFEMMVERRRMPNETTYVIVVEGIAHEGELELAREVLEELRSRKVVGQNAVDRIVMQFNLDFD
ncbi:hypothetical protein HID58_073733 [Brassica napus]|uniref:(rape) hypothetical protein n=1 Tax=Brassica napus TaxID=3708 RepID=A0A816R161_BRANA|nr:pentatricopeptide repeat-containing protein At1g79080, chloroplastic-like [Brassica napus]XP_048626876.1 pentatricopeptide repeat-containing protein At1g79080, chloroplastic-like [Brassica napus]KAH0854409.1 hypothetical protein HID58_073733 [Brassica napus]CAF2065652.1 unnamed protein product [Brassica napus]